MLSRIGQWHLLLVATLLLVGAVGACAGDDDESSASSTGSEATAKPAAAATSSGSAKVKTAAEEQFEAFPEDGMPQYGGVYRSTVRSSGYENLSFLRNATGDLKRLGSMVYTTLIGWDYKSGRYGFNSVAPNIAKSWETSADGTVWTFKLRDDILWHDGSPLTSADIKFSIDYYVEPPNERPPGSVSYRPYVKSVEAPDAHTVIVTLKAPNPIILQHFATAWSPMLPKKYYDQDPGWFRTHAIGSGGYKWVDSEWKPNIGFRIERNEDYWKNGLPYLDAIQFFVIKDIAGQASAFETKRIDVTQRLKPGIGKPILEKYGDKVTELSLKGRGVSHYVLNTLKPPFDNPKVRQAVYYWMDRDELLEKDVQGHGYVLDWVDGEYSDFGMTTAELRKSNIAYQKDKTAAQKKAKELLADAGWSDLSKVTLRVLAKPTLEAQFKRMGFKTESVTLERLASRKAQKDGDFDVTSTGMVPPFYGGDYIINRAVNSIGNQAFSGLKDAELDKLLEAMNTTVDPNKRKQAFAALDKFLQTGVWSQYPMYRANWYVLTWSYLHGLKPQSWYDDPMDRVWLDADAAGRK